VVGAVEVAQCCLLARWALEVGCMVSALESSWVVDAWLLCVEVADLVWTVGGLVVVWGQTWTL
jgi:hypothetical protein